MAEESKSPPHVPAAVECLIKLGCIHSIKVDYEQTGTDTAETFVTLKGSGGEYKTHRSAVHEYLDIGLGYNTIAQVKQRYTEQHEKWKAWESRNKKDLSEFKRLKNKLGL